jgi:hypothetical protein
MILSGGLIGRTVVNLGETKGAQVIPILGEKIFYFFLQVFK